jgi:hypothetical protein
VRGVLGAREPPGSRSATAAEPAALATGSFAASGVRSVHATPVLDPSPPGAVHGSSRATGLAELGAQLQAAGLSEAAIMAVSEQLPGWPSLSRDPEGFRLRLEGLLGLAGGDARLASAALAREPRLLTRVPDALRRESASLARLLGCGPDGVARLVAAVPQALMLLGTQGVAQRLDGLATALVAGAGLGQRSRGSRRQLPCPPAPAAAPERALAGGMDGSAADHPCAPLVLRAPELLMQSPSNTQQRLASLAAALHEVMTGSGSGAGGGADALVAHNAQASTAAAHRVACALVRTSPELLLATGQTLSARVRELMRLLGPDAVAELCTPRHAQLLALLLLRRGEQLRRRFESLRAMLPGLLCRQLLVLMARRELRWEQLDFLRHTGAVPAWGAHHHRGRQQPAFAGGKGSSSSSSSSSTLGGRGSDGGSASSHGVGGSTDAVSGGNESRGGGSSGGAVHALHVARLALTREPGAFARQHPEFPEWVALRQAVHAAPGESGWRAQFDRELVGPVLTAWLRGMAGRWPRLLVCRANFAALSAAEARQRRAQQRAAIGGAGGGGTAVRGKNSGGAGVHEGPLLPSLQRLQAMNGAEWARIAGRLPVQLPPPLGELSDSEAMQLLRGGSGALAACVETYAAAWDAVAAEAAAGPPAWRSQLGRWRELLPAAVAETGATPGLCDADSPCPSKRDTQQALRQQLSRWWHCLLDEHGRAALLARLRFLRRMAGSGGGQRGAAGAQLWPALAASDEAFAADHPCYAAWCAVEALAHGRREWEAELADPSLSGGALAEWLRAVAAGPFERLRFLAVADGGAGWRACGLREAVAMDREAFADLFPDYSYGAWRLLLADGGGDGGSQYGAEASGQQELGGSGGDGRSAATPGRNAVLLAVSSAAAASRDVAQLHHTGGTRAAKLQAAPTAAAVAAPASAQRSAELMGASHDLMEIADRDPAWCAEARGWAPATWGRVLRAISRTPALLARANFLLATGGASTSATARPPLASVLRQSTQVFEAAHPPYALWSGARTAVAGVAPWRAQLEGWSPAECSAVLNAALEACCGAGPAPSAAPSGARAGDDPAAVSRGPQRRVHPERERVAAAASEALARLKFLAARGRWRRVEGGLREALLMPRDALVRRWPQYDPPRAEVLAAQKAELERPPRPEWVGAKALQPGAFEALPARARAAAEAGRLEQLQRLAHTSPAWELAFQQYNPRSLERMLLATPERVEHAAYLAE